VGVQRVPRHIAYDSVRGGRMSVVPLPFSAQWGRRWARVTGNGLPSRAITRGPQVMSRSPFANADAGLQAIFVCRSEMNAPV